MYVAYSPPKRRQNKNQIKKGKVHAKENPISSADVSTENTALDQSERDMAGGSRQSPNMSQQTQGNISQDPPGTGLSQPPPEGRGQGNSVNTPPLTVEQLIQSPLFGQAVQPIVSRMNVMEDTMNTLLDKINGLVSRMLNKESEENGPTEKTNIHPDNDETDYSADDDAVELNRQSQSKQHATVSVQNGKANQSSSAFTPYSRSEGPANFSGYQPTAENVQSNPLAASHGSVERELRHVHFHSNLNAPERSNPLNANIQPLHAANNILQPLEQTIPYLIGVKIGRPLPNGRIVDDEVFVTEQQYRQMLNLSVDFQNQPVSQRGVTQSSLNDRARSVSRASTYSFNSNNLASSTQCAGVDYQLPRTRRGNLSWRSSDSSDDDQYYHPVNFTSSSGAQDRQNASHIPRGRNESHHPNSNNDYQPSALKIGQIVNSWKISFPKTEKDPEQFLLILKDLLSSSGIQRDLFVPCLSRLFEGAYRSWYLVNKASWRSWKDFVRAFRGDWVVKKADADLLYEVRDLLVEKNESLAEFACRARLIFERMQTPPLFREQLRQILTKFNPRLTCEVLNLGHLNYTQFFHYINERSYLYQRSNAQHNNNNSRRSARAPELKVMQEQAHSSDEPDEDNIAGDEETFTDQDAEQEVELRFMKNNKSSTDSKKSSKSSDSKTLTRQRLEQNLERFDNSGQNKATSSATERNKSNQNKPPFDPNKLFCVNCGQTAHTARYCKSDRQVVCYSCRKTGHETKNCPTQQGNANSPQ